MRRAPALSAPPVRTLVLDLGGVVVDWDPRPLYRKLFAGDTHALAAAHTELRNQFVANAHATGAELEAALQGVDR